MDCAHTVTKAATGTGPHYQRLDCMDCGKFLKWLPWPETDEGKQQFLDRFTAIAKNKGYLRGWAWHRFNERFGHFPEGRADE